MTNREWSGVEEKDLPEVAEALLHFAGEERILAFSGDLGAGKTTFIKVFCTLLGVKEDMSSPTFSLVNEYRGDQEQVIYHFDFYRIQDESEAFDLGYEEYFYSGNFCCLEWPEKIPHLLPPHYVQVRILEEENGRRITISKL